MLILVIVNYVTGAESIQLTRAEFEKRGKVEGLEPGLHLNALAEYSRVLRVPTMAERR